MTKELKEKLAHSAANDWCKCYKCDGVVGVGIAEGMVNEFCKAIKEDYE